MDHKDLNHFSPQQSVDAVGTANSHPNKKSNSCFPAKKTDVKKHLIDKGVDYIGRHLRSSRSQFRR